MCLVLFWWEVRQRWSLLALRKRKVKAEYSAFSKEDPKTRRKRKVSSNIQTRFFVNSWRWAASMGFFSSLLLFSFVLRGVLSWFDFVFSSLVLLMRIVSKPWLGQLYKMQPGGNCCSFNMNLSSSLLNCKQESQISSQNWWQLKSMINYTKLSDTRNLKKGQTLSLLMWVRISQSVLFS